jgi:chorismate dehydratase
VPGDAEITDVARFSDEPHEARLVIGDAALLARRRATGEGRREEVGRRVIGDGGGVRYPFVYDLGLERKSWTGLPFVF